MLSGIKEGGRYVFTAVHHVLTRQIGEIMAAGVVVTIPLIILVLFFQKKIIAGLTAGAVKG